MPRASQNLRSSLSCFLKHGLGSLLVTGLLLSASLYASRVGEQTGNPDQEIENLFPAVAFLSETMQKAQIQDKAQRVIASQPISIVKEATVESSPEISAETSSTELKPQVVVATGEKSSSQLPIASAQVSDPSSATEGNSVENLPVGNAPALERMLRPLREAGKLPLPIAKTSPSGQTSYIQNYSTLGADPEQLSDITGNTNRSSFGKNPSDGTFQSVTSKAKDFAKANAGGKPEPKSPYEKEKEKEKEKELQAKMKEGVKNLVLGITPFDKDDYNAYQEARDLFFKESNADKALGEIEQSNEETFPAFVDKVSNLFGKNGFRDNDTFGNNGKDSFEAFVKDRASNPRFNFPNSRSPKEKLHEADRIDGHR